jgi:hypothetical protein
VLIFSPCRIERSLCASVPQRWSTAPGYKSTTATQSSAGAKSKREAGREREQERMEEAGAGEVVGTQEPAAGGTQAPPRVADPDVAALTEDGAAPGADDVPLRAAVEVVPAAAPAAASWFKVRTAVSLPPSTSRMPCCTSVRTRDEGWDRRWRGAGFARRATIAARSVAVNHCAAVMAASDHSKRRGHSDHSDRHSSL